MPNWCSNELTVTGPKKDLARFKKQADNGLKGEDHTALSFQKFIPMPKELEDTKSPPDVPGTPNWYDWRLANWGIKWDVNAHCQAVKGALIYTFDSPWTEPTKAFDTISEQYPTLTLDLHCEYEEGGYGGNRWEPKED